MDIDSETQHISSQRKGLLSIGVPVFNEEGNIEEALHSLLCQDYQNFEIIISDNKSNDATVDLCQKIANLDSRISIYKSEINRGAGWNFQNVLSLANGEYFMWAGAHDRWKSSFASSCISALKDSPKSVTVYPAAIFIDQYGESLGAISTAYDTRGVDSRIRPWLTAWLLISHYAYPFYGIHKTDMIRKIVISNKCIGPDLVALFELAFLGSTVYVSGLPQIEMRKNSDYGNWVAYFNKVYCSSEINYQDALKDMSIAYSKAIKRRTKGIRARFFHSACLMIYMPVLRNLTKTAIEGLSLSRGND